MTNRLFHMENLSQKAVQQKYTIYVWLKVCKGIIEIPNK